MRLLFAFLALAAIGAAADEPLLLQKPTLSKTHIVFAYAGDLWSVPREGGAAVRLTSGTGDGNRPGVFARRHAHRLHRRVRRQRGRLRRSRLRAACRKGSRGTRRPIAFWAGRLTASASSSVPRGRPTRVSARCSRVPAEGGVEEKLPLPSGYEASMSADGQSIAYEPTGKAFHDVEEISRRPDYAHLARPPFRQQRDEGAAHEFQRLQPDVGRRPRLLPVGPQRAGDALLLRREDQGRARGDSRTRAST